MPNDPKHPAGIDPANVDPAVTSGEPSTGDEPVDDNPAGDPIGGEPSGGDEPTNDDPNAEEQDAKEELFQTRYQRMLAKLDARDPAMATEIKRELRDEARRGEPADDDDLKDIEADATLADIPLAKAIEILDRRQEKRMTKYLEQSDQRQRLNETNAALSADLGELATAAGLTNEEVAQVIANTNAIIPESDKLKPGGPERWARLATREIAYARAARGRGVDPRKAAAEAEDKVRKTIVNGQPPRTATPHGQPSEKQKRLNEMERVGPRPTASVLLDSARGKA